MNFQVGKWVYTQILKEECLKFLYNKIPIFVIHRRYEKDILYGGEFEWRNIFLYGSLTIPISDNDEENEQVFCGDLKNLKTRSNDKDIEHYFFFTGANYEENS